MKNVLVTGASGFVGSNLCAELYSHGYNVRALHRATSNLSSLNGIKIDLHKGDVTDKESIRKAAQGIDTIYHIAAVFREAKHPDSYYFDVNTKGTQNIIEIAEELGIEKVIHCSTTGVHGHVKNPPANEETAFAPRDVYQISKCQAEDLINKAIERGKIKAAIVRPAMIWGPGDKRIFKLFKGIGLGILPIIGNGKTWTHWIMIDDLVRAFRLVGEKNEAMGNTFIIAGDRPVTMSYVYERICKFFGKKPPFLKVPVLPIWIAGAICELICLPLGMEPPLHRRRVDFYTKNRIFDVRKSNLILDFKPSRTFEEEVEYLASWYVQNNWIEVTA
ncbi:MAG: SDR family NAD(P)-dependent oxidoreductase [bacterium]|nr:SDR family NAD(P)-dependent oxidoreductase [bacterium]